MANYNLIITEGSDTFTLELVSSVETDCATQFTYKVNAEIGDSIEFTLSSGFVGNTWVSQSYQKDGVEFIDWIGASTKTITYNSGLYIKFAIENSGTPGLFYDAELTVANTTQSLTRSDIVSRNNDSVKCGTAVSGLWNINSLGIDYVAGRVGIGTASPDSLLEIASDSVTDFLKLTSTGGGATPIKLIFEKNTLEQGVIEYNRNGDLEIYNTDADGGVMIDGSASEGADLYVANTGNVGIGTTTPTNKLEVVGGNVHFENEEGFNTFLDVKGVDANAYIRAYSGSNSLWLYQGGSSSYLQAQAGSTLRLGSGTSNLVITNTSGEVMRISGSNVGIGTTNPSEKLEVSGGIKGDALFLSDGGDYEVKLLTGNITAFHTFTFPDNEGTLAITSDIPSPSQWDDVTGGINYASGNVGIGTTSPISKLHLGGAIGGLSTGITFGDGDTGIWEASDDNLRFSTSSSTRMVITSSGNIGIGTTSPGQKLHVEGITYSTNGYKLSDGFSISALGSNSAIRFNGGNILINNSLGSEFVRFDAVNKRVGIGTTAPSYMLDVDGDARLSGAFYDSNNLPGTAGKVLSSTGSATSWIEPSSVITRLIPHFQTATPGGSDTYTQSNNVVDFDWSGGSGTYEYILPSATAIPYRTIRFVNKSNIVASDKIHITAPSGETIDGAAFYEINKPYNGCAVWSDGVEWIVIQAKA